jgi:glycine/D-amino acid oxidase-like deaminating enzyme
MEMVIVVIGAGVAGMSSCYYLSLGLPKGFSEIHCFDDGNPIAPSRDRFKIVRVDYADEETMERAMKSHKLWQTLPDFEKFSKWKHRLVAYTNHETYHQIAINRKKFGLRARPVLSSQEVREKYELQLPEDTIIVLEEDTLLVNLSECIKSMRSICEKRGVKFIDAHVDKLKYNNNSFSGVTLADGSEISYAGATVVVAPGPWSQSLLMRSGRKEPERMAKCVQCFVFNIEVDVHRTDPIISLLGTGEYHVLLT